MRLRRRVLRFTLVAAITTVVVAATPAIAEAPSDGMTPNPARQPSIHRSQTSGALMGSLRIPAIDLVEPVRSGVAISVIDQGVAHWAGTAAPGEIGNVVLAGHRTTHTRPFFSIDALETGDLVYLTDGDGFEVIYSVTDSFVVEPTDLWITYDSGDPTLTLFACHPRGSARYRIVVTADLVAGRRIA